MFLAGRGLAETLGAPRPEAMLAGASKSVQEKYLSRSGRGGCRAAPECRGVRARKPGVRESPGRPGVSACPTPGRRLASRTFGAPTSVLALVFKRCRKKRHRSS